jgi:uncharacterized protein
VPLFHAVAFRRLFCLAPLSAGLALAGCTTAPTREAGIWLGQVAQGEQSVQKPLKSWKALKFTNLVQQQTEFSCGAAALATIFNYAYGRNTTEAQVLLNMLKIADPDVVQEKGFSLLDMKNYVLAIGMQAEGYSVPYDSLSSMKVPGIALLNLKGYKHFVVIRKADAEYVHVGDPALGNRVIRRRDFERDWNGVVFVVIGDGYDANTVLRNPPPPLSARRLFDQRSPVPNAEVYDFGLGPAYNFIL